MILCLDISDVEKSNELQKIDLGELLNNHAKYLAEDDEALRKDYRPLSIMLSIRSTYSNKVLNFTADVNKQTKVFTSSSNIPVLPHRGYDLIMYIASILLMDKVTYTSEFANIMMKSEFVPLGFYYSGSVLNPVIYCYVIIDDSVVEEFSSFLKDGIAFIDIADVDKSKMFKFISDTLVLSKEKNDGGNNADNEEF